MNGVELQKTSFLCSMDVSQKFFIKKKGFGGWEDSSAGKVLVNKHEDLS